VIKSQEEFYQKMPSDFLFPLNLDQESLKKMIEEKENSKKMVEEKEKKKSSGWQYVVKKGETLWQISKKFKVPLEDLLYYNGLSENSIIKAGDKIVIPGVKPQAIIAGPVKKFAGKFVSALQEIGNFIVPTSGFNWGKKHSFNGTDISAPCGSEVYAAQSGVVVESSDGWNSGYGNYIIIRHGNGSYSLYGHLSLRLVEVGNEVEKGELIGYVGNTGYTLGPTGCHLHFEVRGGQNPLLK
jgi:murein DD-endopeptidase MepM/ murein hydrolase activator NlpD